MPRPAVIRKTGDEGLACRIAVRDLRHKRKVSNPLCGCGPNGSPRYAGTPTLVLNSRMTCLGNSRNVTKSAIGVSNAACNCRTFLMDALMGCK